MKQSRVVSPTITLLIAMVALISFGAGYLTRPIRAFGGGVADGNPVGFKISGPITATTSGNVPKCLQTGAAATACPITLEYREKPYTQTCSTYCAKYYGKSATTIIWSDGHETSHSASLYGKISSP
jgi:hypothetical protein